eukprot:XP_001701699.1 predicted protein [Chlamydomonas reinhardtii]
MAVDVAEQAKFFDHLVELVPAKYYYDDEFAKVNPRFLAKAARDAFKAEAKTKAKEAKRERLDPDKAATTLELQRRGRKGPAGAKRPPKAVLLKKAEQQRAELEALAGTEEGKAKAQQAAFKAALARAAGEKVLDDPKLLRRTLKREAKKREKSGKAWQERRDQQQEAVQARQAKRTDNLAARRQTKADNKKAKREKKLLRPGFEGRKEGFVNAAPK